MHELTFLDINQIIGDTALDIIKKRGTKAAITDFAILLGGVVSSNHYAGFDSLDKRTGYYWTKTDDNDNDVCIVKMNGNGSTESVTDRSNGARIVLTIPDISPIPTNGVFRKANDGILEIEYGYYPRSAVSKEIQQLLEQLFKSNMLNKTGNTYTTDSFGYDSDNEIFCPQTHIEYIFDEKKYVRVKANIYDNTVTLSNREIYISDDYVWIEVEPVKWLFDEKEKIMVTEELIFSGVQFNNESNYKGVFEKTDIKLFMDKYLSKELFQNLNTINLNNNTDTVSAKIIKELYSKGYTKEQITTIALDILNQMLKNTTLNKTDVKQKLKTPNK